MPSQAPPNPTLPQPALIAIGTAAVAIGRLERTARSVAGPLWRLVRQVPGVAEPLDATLGTLADGGAEVLRRTATGAEALTRQVLRVALPIVFDELMALEKLDLTGLVLRHADLDAIIAHLDLLALVHHIIGQMDLTKLVLEQVDIDKVIISVDLDAAVHRVDLLGLANEIIEGVNLPEIIRESTGALSTDAVRGVRTRGVDADAAVSGFVDRLLGRGGPNHSGPGHGAPDQGAPERWGGAT